MERVIILLLFFSPLSFAGDNTTTIITKGSGSTITSKQVGNGNATNILCGANSNGSFPGTTYVSHTCSNATWSSTITGIAILLDFILYGQIILITILLLL